MGTGEKKMILLVEDEFILAMTEKMALERFGYAVITAMSGEEAVSVAAANRHIDLILMDINLGNGIDGTEAASLILKDRDVPVLFLSSHTEPAVVEKTEKITSYGYVVKNSSFTVLDASIKMAFKLFDATVKLGATIETLETHQIELRMQNEEFILKQMELEALKTKYFRLYDLAPAGDITMDERGVILEANLAATGILGTHRANSIAMPFDSFIPEDDQDGFYLEKKRLLETGKPKSFNLKIKRPDATIIPAWIKATSALGEDGAPVLRLAMLSLEETVPIR